MKQSAGILLFKKEDQQLKVMLVHPGGPFFAKKDAGHWSVPKGEFEQGEDPLEAARREFREETGYPLKGKEIPLQAVKQKGGKVVLAWAVPGDLDVSAIRSNTFEIEWPPRSGRRRSFPEIDQAAWFSIEEARVKINPAQQAFLDELIQLIETKKGTRGFL